jgi:hypothetical protein
MNLIPKIETQTLEDLKSIGLHGNNLVQVERPSFFFNREIGEITYDDNIIFDDKVVVGISRFTVISRRLFINDKSYKSQLEWWNSRKLIAWYPSVQYGNDIAYLVRFKTLID